jgi:hypothetical protein
VYLCFAGNWILVLIIKLFVFQMFRCRWHSVKRRRRSSSRAYDLEYLASLCTQKVELRSVPRLIITALCRCAGFVLRVALTSRLTIPRLLELASAIVHGQHTQPVRSVNGKDVGGSILEPQRVVLILGSAGLTGLNVLWLCKILSGVWKVLARGRNHAPDNSKASTGHNAPTINSPSV